jgi:predicted double-glycine peptidase
MAFTLHRAGISPIVAAISLLPLVLVYTGCRNNQTLDGADGELSPAAFGVPKNHFEYCELKPVVQKSDPSGGLASLEAVLRYWDTEVTETELANKYPPPSGRAHSIRKLRRIAIDQGVTAFALVMKDNGLEQLSEQLLNGRPVIVALQLPDEPIASPADVPGDTLQKQRFAVVYGQSEREFLMMDPGAGVVRIDKDEFEIAWAGGKHAALICSSS